ISGEAIGQGPETFAVNWYSIEELPVKVFIGTHEFIQDFLANQAQIIERTQYYPFWQVSLIRGLISLRDLYNRITMRPYS
ncbi:MAG: hypothetical protein N2D54_09930, partial [Chloroflexota bacterium]